MVCGGVLFGAGCGVGAAQCGVAWCVVAVCWCLPVCGGGVVVDAGFGVCVALRCRDIDLVPICGAGANKQGHGEYTIQGEKESAVGDLAGG